MLYYLYDKNLGPQLSEEQPDESKLHRTGVVNVTTVMAGDQPFIIFLEEASKRVWAVLEEDLLEKKEQKLEVHMDGAVAVTAVCYHEMQHEIDRWRELTMLLPHNFEECNTPPWIQVEDYIKKLVEAKKVLDRESGKVAGNVLRQLEEDGFCVVEKSTYEQLQRIDKVAREVYEVVSDRRDVGAGLLNKLAHALFSNPLGSMRERDSDRAGAAMKLKLTHAQIKLLGELPKRCVDNYPPARKLVELGLAEWKRTPAGWDNDFLERTPEGDKVLAFERMKGIKK